MMRAYSACASFAADFATRFLLLAMLDLFHFTLYFRLPLDFMHFAIFASSDAARSA